ncbi:TMEM43 family protein [Amorphus orientalis]|uniref:Uncharacterized protein n=1 Tax=Amorphus orientalis TaxID=649198 RepID=A0AAE4AT57_9HYPH|nr:TMEM43 family protein [Amorphus orientalis]MDQ0314684.1 hypothetical protein [Amorphus orientalis]
MSARDRSRRIKSTVFGIALVAVGAGLLHWNERRVADSWQTLTAGEAAVVPVSHGHIDPANEGRLVHVSGPVRTRATPTDPDYGMSAPGALRLERVAEMFQWVEHKRIIQNATETAARNKRTTYSYEREWVDRPVISRRFRREEGHENPPMPLKGRTFNLDRAEIGAFRVPGSQLAAVATPEPIPIPARKVDEIASTAGVEGDVHLVDGRLVFGTDPDDPQIGDIRLSFTQRYLGEATAVGLQRGDLVWPYETEGNGRIYLLRPGRVPVEDIFDHARSANLKEEWTLRVVGLALMFGGLIALIRRFSAGGGPVFARFGGVRGSVALALGLSIFIGAVAAGSGWYAVLPGFAITVLSGGAALALVVWGAGWWQGSRPGRASASEIT